MTDFKIPKDHNNWLAKGYVRSTREDFIKKTGEEYDPKTKTRTTYYDVYFEAPSKHRLNTEITNYYEVYCHSNKSYAPQNFYFNEATRDWKNAEVTKKYDFGFRIFGKTIGLVYKPATILWWIKKIFKK